MFLRPSDSRFEFTPAPRRFNKNFVASALRADFEPQTRRYN
jgi:hypothetical protein